MGLRGTSLLIAEMPAHAAYESVMAGIGNTRPEPKSAAHGLMFCVRSLLVLQRLGLYTTAFKIHRNDHMACRELIILPTLFFGCPNPASLTGPISSVEPEKKKVSLHEAAGLSWPSVSLLGHRPANKMSDLDKN